MAKKKRTEVNPDLLPTSFGGEYFFTKDDAATNCHREYHLVCWQTLWTNYGVIRSWGRRGSRRLKSVVLEFEEAESALKYLRKAISKRLRRGYQLVEYRENQD